MDSEKLQPVLSPHLERQHNDSPSQKTAMPRWRTKGKEKSTIALACTWVVNHQISISLNLLSVLFLCHIFVPSSRHHTQKFFKISYFNPSTSRFALGWDDICFVFYWIIVFTGLRCLAMDYVLAPVAAQLGISRRKAKIRFAEQAWILLYYIMFWSTGMYIMYNSEYWLNLRAMWRNWPIREMDGLSKWYYLVQFAFWLQQIVVVNIEERRNDHWQMFSHHIITCALIFCSYGYHHSRVGIVILCLMDIVDILLPAAKLLKYLKFQILCDVMFGVFMVTWAITRHVLLPCVLWSIFTHVPEEIAYGCYKGSTQDLQGPFEIPKDIEYLTRPFRDPTGLICWTTGLTWAFASMLLGLQGILCMWFVMIIRVAWKVITGQGADDTRSDDEDEEEGEQETVVEAFPRNEKTVQSVPGHATTELVGNGNPLLQKEVLSNEADFSAKPGTRRSTRRREGGQSSGINVLGSSDRKELLGRIGCEKPTT